MHVINGSQLYIEQVADLPMAVGIVANTVKLQIGVPQARFSRLFTKLLTLGEFDSVGCGLNAVVAQFTSVPDRFDEIRRHGRLATRKLDGHLTSRLDFQGIPHDFLDLLPTQFVNITHLVGIHEARIAHHVTTIGKVYGENGPPTVLDRAGAVVMQPFIIMGSDVTSRKILFDPLQKLYVLGH